MTQLWIDDSGFATFMQAHQDLVYNVALNMLRSQQDAEDLTQEVFCDVYRKPEAFGGASSVRTWLYRLAMNKCIDQLRRKRTRARVLLLLGMRVGEADFVHPGIAAEQLEHARILARCIAKLPLNQRSAFVAWETSGMGQQEIAESLGISVGAVESLLVRARKNLRKEISKYYSDGTKMD